MSADLESTLVPAHTFAPGVSEKIAYYVYILLDPRTNEVFYVGKGTGNRCFAHVAEARKTGADTLGDYAKLTRIREIEAAGAEVRIELLRHGLTEREAFLVESTAIDLLGMEGLVNRVTGHEAAERGRLSISDVNVLYGATPVSIAPEHRVVLLRIKNQFERGMTDDTLYEATRKWWKVDSRRFQPGLTRSPEWAMAVYEGVVRAVYRIEAWEPPTDEDIVFNPNDQGRWAFRGARDLRMEASYLYRDVSNYLRSSQNPVCYVNCGGGQQGLVESPAPATSGESDPRPEGEKRQAAR